MEDAHAGMTFFLKIVARTFGFRFSAKIFAHGILRTKFMKGAVLLCTTGTILGTLARVFVQSSPNLAQHALLYSYG